MECFANESPSSSSYSASSRAETFRLEGRALLTIFFNFSSEPSSSGRRCGGIGAAAEEVDRAEEGTISGTLATAYTQREQKLTLDGEEEILCLDLNRFWFEK